MKNKYVSTINIICMVQFIAIILYLIIGWNSFPEQIPGHFNAAGEVTRYDGRGALLIGPIVGGLLFGGLVLLGRFPQVWNTGVKVTEENRERIYRIVGNLIATMSLAITTSFVFITIVQSTASRLPSWFTPASLAATFVPMLFFIVKLIKSR